MNDIGLYQEKTAYQKLLDKIYKKKVRLSFSALAEFAKSPQHFINYKLGEKKETPSMKFGTLVHTLVLEPDSFDERYVIGTIKPPSTVQGQQFCSMVLDGHTPSDAFKANYKRGSSSSTYEKYSPYIESVRGIKGRVIVSQGDYELATKLKTTVWNNPSSRHILDQVTETERDIKWTYSGFNWRGFIDMKGKEIKADLKVVADASPKKFRWKIWEMKYHWQAAMYIDAEMEDCDYYIIAIDRSCNISVHLLSRATLNSARMEINEAMATFKRCMLFNAWRSSYDFHSSNGIFEV